MSFADNLSALPTLEHLTLLTIQDDKGQIFASIENKPGTQGSFRVYHYVAQKWGSLNASAAREALTLFAEHTEDARQHPGKHPNIDRLLTLLEQGSSYTIQVI